MLRKYRISLTISYARKQAVTVKSYVDNVFSTFDNLNTKPVLPLFKSRYNWSYRSILSMARFKLVDL